MHLQQTLAEEMAEETLGYLLIGAAKRGCGMERKLVKQTVNKCYGRRRVTKVRHGSLPKHTANFRCF